MSPSDANQDSAPAKAQWFTTTHWTVVLNAADSKAPSAQAALEKLCRTYWYPLYAYVRRQGRSPEDAQDLTQEFFARILEKNSLSRADRQRGRFRTFLLTSFQNFLAHERERARAQKRGSDPSCHGKNNRPRSATRWRQPPTRHPTGFSSNAGHLLSFRKLGPSA